MRLPSWRHQPGPLDAITDVPGVSVGHASAYRPEVGSCSGVTCVMPAPDVVTAPVPAAVHVINGYGKSVGLTQIEELGTLESPIVLTSVFALPRLHAALADWLMTADPTVGHPDHRRSANAVVLECNDAYLHDPACGWPDASHLRTAMRRLAGGAVEEGTVGAGVGMCTFGLSGAIGTASRVWESPDVGRHTLGAMVLTNFGLWGDLLVAGEPIQRRPMPATVPQIESAGSVIVLLATDATADAWLLRRVARRAQNGLARTGCMTAGRSGEIVIAFGTRGAPPPGTPGTDDDTLFRVTAEAVEAAVLSGLRHATAMPGRLGRRLPTLAELSSGALPPPPAIPPGP